MVMRRSLLVVVVLTGLLCSPLWAWRRLGDPEELNAGYQAAVRQALDEAKKALEAQPPEVNRARYLLLAVSDLCVPGGGHDPKVPAELIAEYKAFCPKAWAPDQVPDRQQFEVAVKQYQEKFEQGYINAFSIADSPGSYTVKRVAEEFGKAASRYPEALALCLEFAGKAIPPEEYQKYCYGEKESWGAVVIQGVMANVCGGPETIRRMSKEVFVPNAVEEADTVLKRGEQETEADMLRLRAGDADPFLDFVRWADPENATLKELQAKQNALREKAKALYAAEVKGNRVSPDRYGGGDAAALKQAMKQAFRLEGQFTIVRVTITSGDWREQAHVWSGINALDVGWYRLIDGAIVVKLANGTCWVHPVTFGKRWTGTGDKYGELAVYSWADRYEILPANVNQ